MGLKLSPSIKYAIKNGADFIFQTDSDGQTLPEEFDAFWQLRNERDAILGIRTVREDGISRKWVEKVVCILLRIFFGIKVPDANAPFRLMKASLVKKYIHMLPSNYNLPNIMTTAFFSYYHENIQFMEISFRNRQGGTNTINIPKIISIGKKALGDFYRFRKVMKMGKA